MSSSSFNISSGSSQPCNDSTSENEEETRPVSQKIPKYTVQKIKDNLASGKWKTRPWIGSNIKAFSVLVVENNRSTDIRVCDVCKSPYSKRSKASLKAHSTSHSPDESNHKNELIDAATKFVTSDGRSFRTLDTPAFQNYAALLQRLQLNFTKSRSHLSLSGFQTHMTLPNKSSQSTKMPSCFFVKTFFLWL